jgi:relaxase-like protein
LVAKRFESKEFKEPIKRNRAMIAKIESINFTKNALEYCERGGEVIYWNKCFGNSSDIYQQMKENNAYSVSTKPTFHAKIRIAPEDNGKLSTQQWIDIAEKYADKIGFRNTPFVIYLHEENSEKEHIHIVASRVGANNILVSDSYTNYKNLDFCRDIEANYGLRKVERKLEAIKLNTTFVSSDVRIPPLIEKVSKAINQADSMSDFIFYLNNHNIKVHKGRGIAFTDENGIYIKGSKLGRQFSLKNIELAINSHVEIMQITEPARITVEPKIEQQDLNIDEVIPIYINPKHYREEEDEDVGKSWKKKQNNMGR